MNYCRFFIENYEISWLAAPGCSPGCSLGCSWLLLFWAPGATLKTRFREGVFEPLENGPIWGAFGYFLVHWRRPGRRGRFLGSQNNLKSIDPGTHGLEGEFLDENSGPHGFVELFL